jgi:hypothetical protein
VTLQHKKKGGLQMVYLRVGTQLLFIRSTSPEITCRKLVEHLGLKEMTLEEGRRESDETSSLLFITDAGLDITDIDDARHILFAEENGTDVLSGIINEGLCGEIAHVDSGPRILILRVPGNEEKVLETLQKDYQGQFVSWKDGVRIGENGQTLLGLTTQRIHQKLDMNAIYGVHLLIDQPLHECYARLRREAVLYITHTLKEGAWYEYHINIYDTQEEYELHYQRLIHVISALELGFILGESWTHDHALALYSVLAYQVRLFSFMPPEEMKAILIGLEYDEEGRRLVDLDLYYRKKKVAWVQMQKNIAKGTKRNNKKEEGILRQRELMEKLSLREQEKLHQIEAFIKKNN